MTQKEAELVARMTYEQKDIVTIQELDSYLPSDFAYRRKLVYNLKKKRIFGRRRRSFAHQISGRARERIAKNLKLFASYGSCQYCHGASFYN